MPASASPARRIAHASRPLTPKRSSSQGPSHSVTPEPKANSAITIAPAGAVPAKAATITAEYNSPQGSKAHATPMPSGAAKPACAMTPRTRAHTRRAP